ncbi:MAG: ankyrin repeat domain-containing protein [Chlamydiales bacterium]
MNIDSVPPPFHPNQSIEENSSHPMTMDEIGQIVEGDDPIDEQTALRFAQLLKQPGFNPFEINSETKMSLLHKASLKGKTEIVRQILTSPADLSVFDSAPFAENIKKNINTKEEVSQATALIFACLNGHFEIAQMLIEAGASIYEKNRRGQTPLHLAACCGKENIVRLLIDASQLNLNYFNAQDNDSEATALYFASNKGYSAIAQMLIEAGASIDNADKGGLKPLHRAAWNGHFEITEMLIGAGASIDIADKRGYTPLHGAAFNGHFKIVEMLIAASASIDIADKTGHTPLHETALNGRFEMAEMLIAAGASINSDSEEGFTPLHEAAQRGYENVVNAFFAAMLTERS